MIEFRIIPDFNLVITVLSGEIDDQQIENNVRESMQALAGSGGMRELTDCRAVTGVSGVTVDGCLRAAGMEREQSSDMSGALAIVVRTQLHYGMARAFVTMASENRSSVAVCWTIDEAIDVLGLTEHRDQVLAHLERLSPSPPPPAEPD